ncbi:MAG: WXG100 family type VII secretion target [Clostridiales Family XIII bacterium]|jgi:uncharacterized protein YukE|nr:WXG100 family type VII secretion target [Clostridiales Family XIII bacterium]
MAQILIDSQDAESDKRDLRTCLKALDSAKNRLGQMQSLAENGWHGHAQSQFTALTQSFRKQIEGLEESAARVCGMLDEIVNTYRDADRRAGGS